PFSSKTSGTSPGRSAVRPGCAYRSRPPARIPGSNPAPMHRDRSQCARLQAAATSPPTSTRGFLSAPSRGRFLHRRSRTRTMSRLIMPFRRSLLGSLVLGDCSHVGFRAGILPRISQELLATGVGTEAVGLALVIFLEGDACRLECHAAYRIAHLTGCGPSRGF